MPPKATQNEISVMAVRQEIPIYYEETTRFYLNS